MGAAYDAAGLAAALAAYDATLAAQPTLANTPSTFIMASEVLHACGAPPDVCADVLSNVLETKLPDAQTCRVVAYHLLSFGQLSTAVKLLELVKEVLAPAEVHSFTDLAFARLHLLRSTPSPATDVIRSEMVKVISDLTHVLVGTSWPSRYAEIEWPVLVMLSWAVAWGEHTLAEHSLAPEDANLWPEYALPAATYRLGGRAGPSLALFVWLGWDTDKTDVDLHVKEPTGEEVYYSHNTSSTTGGRISRDFTQGMGPEVYTLPRAPKGKYQIETNYYASHQDSAATGSTSAVIWSIKGMGDFGHEEVQFTSVRLTKHKQRQQVMDVDME